MTNPQLLTPRSLAEARRRYADLQRERQTCLALLRQESRIEELYRLRKTLEICERGLLCALALHGRALVEGAAAA